MNVKTSSVTPSPASGKLLVSNTDVSLTPIFEPPSHLIPSVPENYPFDTLSDEQTALVHDLQAQLDGIVASLTGDALPGEKEYCDDVRMIKFLKSTNWKIEESATRLKETLQWRREYKPNELILGLEGVCAHSICYLSGFDKSCRPIMTMPTRNGVHIKDHDLATRLTFYTMEQAQKLMKKGVTNLCIIVDFRDSPMNATPVSHSIKFLNVLSKHYPETLGRFVVVNPTWYMWVLYKMVSPFVDNNTKSKVFFVTSDPASSQGKPDKDTGGFVTLELAIDLDQVSTDLGGTREYTFNHLAYWKLFSAL
ncbi:CRAL-TRIO domain-containing protein [Chytriomyces sp. MP71]|nr:CRAL-TRIO domain-containing protein [Chytriomyces sp. MP71]